MNVSIFVLLSGIYAMKQPQKLIGENSGDEIAVKRYAEKEGIAIGGERVTVWLSGRLVT